MFLFERAFGVGIYILILLLVCGILTKTRARCKPTLKFYTICLCVMGFFYKPYITADLYRTYIYVEFFGDMKFEYFWENFARNTNIPIARVIFWAVGKSGVKELLPVLSAFICYSLLFYIIIKTQEKFAISNETVAIVLFFLMTTSIYISVIGGIRMMLSTSMIAFSFFRNSIEKKNNLLDVSLYVLAVFIHVTAIILIAICMFLMILDNRKSIIKRILSAVVIVAIVLVFVINFREMIFELFEKAEHYLGEEEYSDSWEYLIGVIITIFLSVILFEYWSLRKDSESLVLKYYNMSSVICLAIAVIFCFEFSTFYRFAGHMAVILATPMMMVTLEKSYGKASKTIFRTDVRSMVIVLSVIIALISCTRGSLSSLKFFEI